MQFIYTKTFRKQLQKFKNQIQRIQYILDVIQDFQEKLFASRFYRRQLHGLENVHELEVGGDIRIIIEVIVYEDKCYFLAVGTHSSLGIIGKNKKR